MVNLARIIEQRTAGKNGYPENWPEIATMVKTLAGWRCERCGVMNNEDSPDGTMLTVHHLTGEKWNCALWNLAALCQRCHLRIQNKVVWFRVPMNYDWLSFKYEPIGAYPYWMARHVKQFNAESFLGIHPYPQIPFDHSFDKDYSKEWLA